MGVENFQNETNDVSRLSQIEQSIQALSQRVAETIEYREGEIRIAEFTRDMNEEEQVGIKRLLDTYLLVA